jgi:hypothetical protein
MRSKFTIRSGTPCRTLHCNYCGSWNTISLDYVHYHIEFKFFQVLLQNLLHPLIRNNQLVK